MMHNYLIVQRLDNGKWVNESCHYYLHPQFAFRFYSDRKKEHPEEHYRIVRGKDNIGAPFFKE